MNMDYVLCQVLGYNTNGIDWALTFYDMNCQYHKHLQQQVDESPYLNLHGGYLWHVHSIKTNARYSMHQTSLLVQPELMAKS
jgi:hypothetical protein